MIEVGQYPVYSVDASALIHFKRGHTQRTFPGMWELVAALADEKRLLIAEEVRDECRDDVLKDFIGAHPEMVVTAEHTLDYLARLQGEAPQHGIELIDPVSRQSEGDPYVLAVALMVEERDLTDLRASPRDEPKCVVLTQEKAKGFGFRLANIPNVCDFYGLDYTEWEPFLHAEGYRG